jgi:hypothetical protein
MILSMGLVAGVLLIWMWLSHPRTPDPVKPVGWWPVAQAAADVAEYEVLAPPEGFAWTATSARTEPQPDGTLVWRVGFYTPSQAYAGLLQRGEFPEQAGQAAQDWVGAETRDGQAGDQVTIGGRAWVRMEGDPTPDERRSLVSPDRAGAVTVITGSAPWDELETLAASLEPVDG